MAQLVIFGTGDIARLAHWVIQERDSSHEVARVHGRSELSDGGLVPGACRWSTSRRVTTQFPPESFMMFVALSYAQMNRLRAAKYAAAKSLGYRLATYVSSRCTWLTDHPAGDNCFILEDNTVQPFVRIGSNVTLWSGNHIGHDSTIDDHCFIASHVVVSGHVHIHPYCFVGVNATLRNSIVVASETLIGAGQSS